MKSELNIYNIEISDKNNISIKICKHAVFSIFYVNYRYNFNFSNFLQILIYLFSSLKNNKFNYKREKTVK